MVFRMALALLPQCPGLRLERTLERMVGTPR